MTTLLPYSADHDDDIFVEAHIVMNDLALDIEAASSAGQAQMGGPRKPNEDAFSVVRWGDDIVAAVFDGSSSQKPIPEIEPETGAHFASHQLKTLFESMPAESDLATALSKLNGGLREKFEAFPSVDMADKNSLPTSTATLVRISPVANRVDVAHVVDSFALALLTDGKTHILTNNTHRQYDEKILGLQEQIAEDEGITSREARRDPRIQQAIMTSRQTYYNQGDGIVNGDPNMDQYIYTESFPLDTIVAILIGSDGLVPPDLDERTEAGQKKLREIVLDGGIQRLIMRVRAVEDSDPDWHFVRYKHSDDATGIFISCHSTQHEIHQETAA